jgi:hypothetical protein
MFHEIEQAAMRKEVTERRQRGRDEVKERRKRGKAEKKEERRVSKQQKRGRGNRLLVVTDDDQQEEQQEEEEEVRGAGRERGEGGGTARAGAARAGAARAGPARGGEAGGGKLVDAVVEGGVSGNSLVKPFTVSGNLDRTSNSLSTSLEGRGSECGRDTVCNAAALRPASESSEQASSQKPRRREKSDAEKVAEALIDRCLRKGSGDNMTALVVDLRKHGDGEATHLA